MSHYWDGDIMGGLGVGMALEHGSFASRTTGFLSFFLSLLFTSHFPF